MGYTHSRKGQDSGELEPHVTEQLDSGARNGSQALLTQHSSTPACSVFFGDRVLAGLELGM